MNTTYQHTDGSPKATGKLMVDMVEKYHEDMLPYAHISPGDVFSIIAYIPFREDPQDSETLMRPLYTMQSKGSGGDCDDKAIAYASYCRCVGIPYRFVAVRRADFKYLHHVYTDIKIKNRWIHADCTYNFNCFGSPREKYAEYLVVS